MKASSWQPFRLNNLERVLELWWFFFGTVISELFAGEIRGREDLLSPNFSRLSASRARVLAAAAHDHGTFCRNVYRARPRTRKNSRSHA